MKFEISRTSGGYGESGNPPCEGARRELGEPFQVDERSCATPEEFDSRNIDRAPWLSVGTNHRILPSRTGTGKSHIARDVPCDPVLRWVIDFPDLDALVAFSATHGELVVCAARDPRLPPTVEIYDDYRE